MTAKLSDTSPEAERVLIGLLRSAPAWRKFEMINDLIMTVRAFSMAGLQERFPGAGPQELHRRLATLLLGPELAETVYGPEPNPPTIR